MKRCYFLLFFLFLLFHVSIMNAATEKNQTLLLNVEINTQDLSSIITAYLEKDQLWVLSSDLENMGLDIKKLKGDTKEINEHLYFNLKTVPGLAYTIDFQALELKITALPALFKPQEIDTNSFQIPATPKIRPNTPGMYLTYDASSQVTQAKGYPTSTSLLTDLGVFNKWGTGDSQFLFQEPSSNGGNVIRLNTQWTQDQPEKMDSWRLGDSITSAPSWAGAVHFAGLQYATNFSTQPGLITFPLPNIRGEAILPSTVNLLVNNVVSKSAQVNTGPFIANNIPAVTGAGTVSVITQDIMGRQQVLNVPYYAAPTLLKPGLNNFSYEAGIMRQNFGIRSADYAQYLATGTYNRGVTNYFTAGGHLELLGKQQTTGFSGNYLWHKMGVLSFSIAGSHSTLHHFGALGLLGFTRQATPFSYGVQSTMTSSGFTQLGLQSHQLSPILTNIAYASYDLKKQGSFSFSYTHTKARSISSTLYAFSAPSSEFFTLSYSRVLLKDVSLTCGAVQNLHGKQGDQVFLVVSIGFDKDYSMNTQVSNQLGGIQTSANFAKSLPVSSGYGYSLYTNQGHLQQYIGTVTAQDKYALYNAAVSRLNNDNNFQANIQGSLIHFANETHFSRDFANSGNSFGLVQVPGFGNVKVYSQHQYIGKTNKNGDLVVTNLLPYEQNDITIDANDLPLNTYFSETNKVVVPYYKSGLLIRFPTEQFHTAIIHLVQMNHEMVPEGANISIDGSKQNYFTGETGEVFIQEAHLGATTGVASWENKTCHFNFNLIQMKKPIPDLGVVLCH